MGYIYVYLGAWLIGCILSACSGKKQDTTAPTADMTWPNGGDGTEQALAETIAIEQGKDSAKKAKTLKLLLKQEEDVKVYFEKYPD